MTQHRIAVVGISCRYPDANSPDELWENVLAGRRAFRLLPDERMNKEDYYSPDPTAPDRFYSSKAAVIEGFEFDRVKYRVAGSTYRATDMTHWLALDTAARALADAGFPEGEGLTRQNTGVVIGNSLTGEFSRASIMRLRWPYVRRTVGAALREQGWDDAALDAFMAELEVRYKQPFAPIDEDSLAGGLANTIAGRICNHYDFAGGGYTVDGACSSSLLSVSTLCTALAEGHLDTGIAGGVDLSIDPFEVIGFAKTGALAKGEMRVYDKNSGGFWPGEGCGMLVLMREQDAIEQGRKIYASIVGWGYSSDGKGGITRPEAAGHQLAIDRAYRQAGFGINTVGYLEGHGTGTAVGDATEIEALSSALRAADPDGKPTFLSTLKGNIGHTKAAAGVGGLIKAILAVHHQVIPPATSHIDPHPALVAEQDALQVPSQPQLWPAEHPVRAGVSSMGFGGINTHVVVEQAVPERRAEIDAAVHQLVSSRQDYELLLLDAESTADLRGQAASLSAMCARLSFAELADLSASLQSQLADRPIRAAVLASSPEEAEAGFSQLLVLLDNGARTALDARGTVFLGNNAKRPRIGYLFPGQGAGRRADGGAIRRRFATVDELYREQQLPTEGDLVDTAVAQPRIVTSSVAGLRLLSLLGIEAIGAAGHSLGEITALHWAGALDEAGLFSIAEARGRIMSELDGNGTMANIVAAPEEVQPLLDGSQVVIAGYNSPQQTVISGPVDEVDRVRSAAVANGLTAMPIAVSHAFHSDLVAPAAGTLAEVLAGTQFSPLTGRVVSTVTGEQLSAETDLPALLADQVRAPVRFTEAVGQLADEVDLLLEVGPGRVLHTLANDIAPLVPTISLETDSPSLAGLLRTVAACYVLGSHIQHSALVEGRFSRPLPLDKEFRFFASPCEQAPNDDLGGRPTVARTAPAATAATEAEAANAPEGESTGQPAVGALDVLRRLAAERAELPLEAVSADSNPLDELHLSSITVGQIVNQASRELGLAAPTATSSYATSTLAQLAAMLEELGESAVDGEQPQTAAPGVGPWVRPFAVEWLPGPALPAAPEADSTGSWELFATDRHPLANELQQALQAADVGDGVLLCLPTDCDDRHVGLMLQAAQAALSAPAPARFVVVGDRRGAAGLAKTLCLEAPAVTTTLVSLPLPVDLPAEQVSDAVDRIVAEVATTSGFREVRLLPDGGRQLPVLSPMQLSAQADRQPVLDAGDVLLVTGGGKGITAESALAIARETGASIGLLGRSKPEQDAELKANLQRMADADVRYHYVAADVTSADQVKSAVDAIRANLGTVTAILHGAGRNEPGAITALTESAFERTLAPKIAGLEAVLEATDPGSLKLLVTFGSIIGRAGLRGEADYATANDWLTELTVRMAENYPQCKCLALEWSVWSGSGMGERLGVLESLIREGISPIPTEQGISLLNELLAEPNPPTAIVIMGRAEGLPTITLQDQDVPLLRFIDRTQVHYPGIELVVDADLSPNADLYLADHLLDGDLLFPAVLGMEAMTQTAMALTGRPETPVLADMEFLRPIVVPLDGENTIRIAALVGTDGDVDVVIRCSDTDFQADHFRARLLYSESLRPTPAPTVSGDLLPIDPASQLYGPVLFQGSRFQRLVGYRELAATSCVAEIGNQASQPWFAGYLPQDLVLGDPGTRDAMMHSLQCCVPDATLLPAALQRLYLADPDAVRQLSQLTMYACERSRDGDTYVYDVDVRTGQGELVERWEGLQLRAVRKLDGTGPWLPSLLGSYLQRRTEPVLGVALQCAVRPDGPNPAGGVTGRRERTAKAIGWALGGQHPVSYRPDGKPTVDTGHQVSSAHGAGVTFAVAGQCGAVGCDVELASTRSEQDWVDLLGAEPFSLAKLVSAELNEDFTISATRVWGAVEALRKIGRARVEPLTLTGSPAEHWVVLGSGHARVASFVTALDGIAEPVVFAMLTETKG